MCKVNSLCRLPMHTPSEQDMMILYILSYNDASICSFRGVCEWMLSWILDMNIASPPAGSTSRCNQKNHCLQNRWFVIRLSFGGIWTLQIIDDRHYPKKKASHTNYSRKSWSYRTIDKISRWMQANRPLLHCYTIASCPIFRGIASAPCSHITPWLSFQCKWFILYITSIKWPETYRMWQVSFRYILI